MKNGLFGKVLTYGIILLFFGANFLLNVKESADKDDIVSDFTFNDESLLLQYDENGYNTSDVFEKILEYEDEIILDIRENSFIYVHAGKDINTYVDHLTLFEGYVLCSSIEKIECAWDFDGDEVYDSLNIVYSGQTDEVNYTYNESGIYNVTLKAMDPYGNISASYDYLTVYVNETGSGNQTYREESKYEGDWPDPPDADGITEKYAVMINGGSESRFWIDVNFTYPMLIEDYNFTEDHIYLLNNNGLNPNGENPDGMIDYRANYSNVVQVFNTLAGIIDNDDLLFLWVDDHGMGYYGLESGYCYGYLYPCYAPFFDPGDEHDYIENEFKLRSLLNRGEYCGDMGMGYWQVVKAWWSQYGYYMYYRHKYVSSFSDVYFEELNTTASNNDILIERFVDYLEGDYNQDGYIDPDLGEIYDYDNDSIPPYDPETGIFDEDDWGNIHHYSHVYNVETGVPRTSFNLSEDYAIFDVGLDNHLDIDLNTTFYQNNKNPECLEVDGTDLDNEGMFDGLDVNEDGDMDDWISIDEQINLYDKPDLRDDELADYVGHIDAANIIIFMEPCFSGGFIWDLSASNRVICTATVEEDVSWGNVFVRGFTSALHGADIYDNPVDADYNGDGNISIVEAFNYSAEHDNMDEVPQYDDNGDGISHAYPIPNGGDGELGYWSFLWDVDTTSPVITNVSDTPDIVGFGFDVIIYADAIDNESVISSVKVNITYPNDTKDFHVFTMKNTENDTYEYNFSDTWLVGQYNYTIYANDILNNSNSSSVHSFNVSAQLNVSVKTLKDDYYHDEYINLTDPPDPTTDIGYELLDDNSVLHMWNTKNDYYFNTTSGVQLTNHYDEYWSHNVLMLGYYYNDEWNLIYRTDELNGFNKEIDTDNETYINITLWKDLAYQGYSFRLAIRYHIGVDDSDLTVIPYIKNLGDPIPYVLGFGWEINDIKIANTYLNDWIRVNDTSYRLDQALDKRYTNLTHTYQIYNETNNETTNYSVPNPRFVLEGRDEGRYFRRTLYLSWDENLDYLLWVKNRTGQYNAPVSLFIKIGELPENAERSTMLHWLDSDEWLGVDGDNLQNFSGEDTPGTLSAALNGTSVWMHSVVPVHWFIIDLEDTYTIKKVRGRSKDFFIPPHAGDPNDVNIYVYDGETAPAWDNTSAWGSKVNPSNISSWVNTTEWQEVEIEYVNGRYIKVEVLSTDADYDYIEWGYFMSPNTIFDVYASEIESKIENTGETDCKGRLLINIEYYDKGTWIVADDTINNETVDTITQGDHMKLDKIFNDIVSTSDFCDISGDISLHRVYVAFRDPDGNVLINDYGTPLNASYEFNVTIYPEIDNVSVTTSDPLDTDSSYGWENFTCTVTDNVEVDDVKLVLVGDDTNEYTMTKDGDDYYHNMTISTADEYTYHILANDTSDNENTSTPESFDMPLNADVDMGGKVHFMDLVAVSGMYGQYGPTNGWCREDVDNGGRVHFMDLIAVSGQYGESWRDSGEQPGSGENNVSVLLANQTVLVNETFTVSIYVEPDEAINGVSFDYLYFNASLIHANSVAEGDLFDPYSTLFSAGTIDNVNGKITDVYGLTIPGTDSVTASGFFCNISFTAQQEVGVSDLDLDGVLISNVAGKSVPIKVFDNNVTVQQ